MPSLAENDTETEELAPASVNVDHKESLIAAPKRSGSELTQIQFQINRMNTRIVESFPDAFMPMEIDGRNVYLLKPLDLTGEDYQRQGLFGDPSDTILLTDMGICIISPFSISTHTSREKNFSTILREAMDKADYYDISAQALNMLTNRFFEQRAGKNFISFSGDINLKHNGQTLNSFIELYDPLERSNDNILVQLISLIKINQKIHSNERVIS